MRNHQERDGLGRECRAQPATAHVEARLAHDGGEVSTAVLPYLPGPSGQEIGERDGIGDIAAGLVQHDNGQRRIVSQGGEDGKLIGIAGGGGDAGAPEMPAVAVVIQVSPEGEGGGSCLLYTSDAADE